MLNSLEIKNFRSLERFEVSKLGRVNLIVGKNNSGKSSVLEALRIYAANAQRGVLEEIASGHDEKFRMKEAGREDADASLPFEDLFTGRRFPDDEATMIIIGETVVSDQALRIEHAIFIETEKTVIESTGETSTRVLRHRVNKSDALESRPLQEFNDGPQIDALYITKDNRTSTMRLDARNSRFRPGLEIPGAIPCSVIPTRFVSIDELADEWDKIGLTDDKRLVTDALKIIAPEFEELMFVKTAFKTDEQFIGGRSFNIRFSRTAMLRMSNFSRPVPLNSLGDGMLRILQLVLKIFSAKNGFLLIDEFENGLHFGVQEKVWALLFELAHKLDIQVFATTHSWDCIESFAKVAVTRQDIEGVLFRVGKSVRHSDRGQVIATVFDEEQLYNITQSDVEVR